MELCFRDCAACETRDPGWNKSPSRRLWHVICDFFKQCSNGGNNALFTQELLTRTLAECFMNRGKRPGDTTNHIVWFTYPGRQRKKAGLYQRVAIDFNSIPPMVDQFQNGGGEDIPLHDEQHPHQVLCAGLKKTDALFFKYITPIGPGTVSVLLVARCMLKTFHVLLNEENIWPGVKREDFVDLVGRVEVCAGVELYKFFSSRKQLKAQILRTLKSVYGATGSMKHIEVGAKPKTNAWAVMEAVGGVAVARNYYNAMNRWEADKVNETRPEVPVFRMNQDDGPGVLRFTPGENPKRRRCLIMLQKRLKAAKEEGILSTDLVSTIYELRRDWIENRADFAKGINAGIEGEALTELSQANLRLCEKYSVKVLNSQGDGYAKNKPKFPNAEIMAEVV
jgi:hypothetical protein